MHEAYKATTILKLTVQIESIAAYGDYNLMITFYYLKNNIFPDSSMTNRKIAF